MVESLRVHSSPLGAEYLPGLAPWVHTFDSSSAWGDRPMFFMPPNSISRHYADSWCLVCAV
ncbi:MAG: hypothetical protein IGR76_16235 [Synechococcales cyanobacterium T60_A2020_003]|nr:hypothetical protein [Synechococcales cyanobacterium T60_A2020_003]